MEVCVGFNIINNLPKTLNRSVKPTYRFGTDSLGKTGLNTIRKGNTLTHTAPHPTPKPLTAEEVAEREAKWEAEKIRMKQEAEARKIEEAKKAEEAKIKAQKDGTWLNEEGRRYVKSGQILGWYPAESNAIDMPIIENEKSLPKRTRNMINILRERGYAVEYQNGILKGEYVAKEQPKFWDLEPNRDNYRNIILIDTKNNKILGCNDVIKEKYLDKWQIHVPKISLVRKGQIKLIEENYAYFSNPYTKTTYYDKDTGEFIKSVEQALYDNNPFSSRKTLGWGPAANLKEEAIKYHRIITTKDSDGTFKSTLYYPGTLSTVEYSGPKGNRTMKITQWENPTSDKTEVLILNQEDMDRFSRYQCSDYFHRVCDRGSGYDIPTSPNLDQRVPFISSIKGAKKRIDELFESGRLKPWGENNN